MESAGNSEASGSVRDREFSSPSRNQYDSRFSFLRRICKMQKKLFIQQGSFFPDQNWRLFNQK